MRGGIWSALDISSPECSALTLFAVAQLCCSCGLCNGTYHADQIKAQTSLCWFTKNIPSAVESELGLWWAKAHCGDFDRRSQPDWYWFLPFVISQYYRHICNVYFSMQGWFIHTWNIESSIIKKVLQWWNILIGPLTVRIITFELKSYLFCSDVPPAVSAPILPLCWHLNTK